MRPSARIAALVEVLTEVEEGIATGGAPADVIVNQYFRARRYAGSKDRRAVTGMLYVILRERETLLWALGGNANARNLVIAYLVFHDEAGLALFDEEGQFAPDPLTDIEKNLIIDLKQVNVSQADSAIQNNVPEWAASGFKKRFGDMFDEASGALNQEAPVDLRANTLKVGGEFIDSFIKDSQIFEKTKFSPLSIRSNKNIGLGGIAEYKSGKLEVQDEAAQVASLLVDAKPGMQVADMCVGAGGKALLVSSQMENKGQVYAFDISGKRLTDCRKRSERGGHRNIQVTRLSVDGQDREDKLLHS